ncbi:MAG: pilus assembly protein [Chloroflexi bacterium]|nr:pilus assembly protein [Chloroflexota bacterium]
MARHRQLAQGLVEYVLIISLVVVLALAGAIVFGPAVSRLLTAANPAG